MYLQRSPPNDLRAQRKGFFGACFLCILSLHEQRKYVAHRRNTDHQTEPKRPSARLIEQPGIKVPFKVVLMLLNCTVTYVVAIYQSPDSVKYRFEEFSKCSAGSFDPV
jgi:hypothetical protein